MYNLTDDDILIISKSILNFLDEKGPYNLVYDYTNTPMQIEMDSVLKKYEIGMVEITEYFYNKYDNSGISFWLNGSCLNYFRLRSRDLYSSLIGKIRENKINEILYE
jgi:hypothetical protein